MRTLTLQTQVSLDGYMAGPNGEMDWISFNWDDGLKEYITALGRNVDTILLGRKLAEGFIPHWASKPEGELPEAVAMMNDTKKIVFSKTLKTSPWANTVIASGELTAELAALKGAPGGDLIAYGGGTFVSGLIEQGLVDALHLIVNPTALGSGMKVFTRRGAFDLVKATPFSCGLVAMHYRPR